LAGFCRNSGLPLAELCVLETTRAVYIFTTAGPARLTASAKDLRTGPSGGVKETGEFELSTEPFAPDEGSGCAGRTSNSTAATARPTSDHFSRNNRFCGRVGKVAYRWARQ
jgi:hypothetical protein